MWHNYLKIALRNLLKHKVYSIINITGLSIGLSCCILIFLFVNFEFSHDEFHANAIYRLVLEESTVDGDRTLNTLFPDVIPEEIAREFPGITHASGCIRTGIRFRYQNESYSEAVVEVDPSFLQMFTFPLLAGDVTTCLNQPNNVVISKSVAQKVFGDSHTYSAALGKTLEFTSGGESKDFIITGVISNVPESSSLQFDMLIPIENYKDYGWSSNWAGAKTVYVQVADKSDLQAIESALPSFVEKHFNELVQKRRQTSLAGDIKQALKISLQPLEDIYLNQEVNSYYHNTGNILYSIILATIACLILFIACINFMTLSIGRSTGRAREVGVRKVLGANRIQLMRQFWGEAVLLVVFAMIIGVVLAELFLPVFNNLAQRQLSLSLFENAKTVIGLSLIMLVTGLIAGSYPAIVLSRFQPATVFKGQSRLGGRNRFTRMLVVIQYALSIVLMITTVVISQQLLYMRSKDLGYNQEQVVIVRVPGEKFSERYKTILKQVPSVINAGGSDRSFTFGSLTNTIKNDKGDWVEVRLIRIDSDYLETLGINLIEGRNFSSERPADVKGAVIVNETFAKTFGWSPILDRQLPDLWFQENQPTPQIIAVVEDFHIDKLDKTVEPLVLHMNPDMHGIYHLFVKIQAEDIPTTIAEMKATWESIFPNEPFRYSFLDENLAAQYRDEQRWREIITYAAIFAILISCLGLLGLAALSVAKRTKEIGVRKVLGASIPGIIALLTSDFIKLVAIANLLAWPIAWFILNQWLANFAYRIHFEWWVFLLAGTLIVFVAILTVGLQSVRAALANPVEALRYE